MQGLQDVPLVGFFNGFRAVVHVQLSIDSFDVGPHCVQGNIQFVSDLFVFQPFGHQAQYIYFTFGERLYLRFYLPG